MGQDQRMEANGFKANTVSQDVFGKGDPRNQQSPDLHGKGVGQHWRNNPWRSGLVLEPVERKWILGTLLGDTSISRPNARSKSPRIYANHSAKQSEWAFYKARRLFRLGPKVDFVENKGFGSELVRMRTSCLPCLNEVHELTRPNGPKQPSRDWLDALGQEGVAWWYCDDGNLLRSAFNAAFHTEGFGEEGTTTIADWVRSKYGAANIYQHRRGYFHIRMPRIATESMFEDIGRHIPECMRYKLGDSNQRNLI